MPRRRIESGNPRATVSLYAYVNPIIAVVLGTLLLAEPFSARIVAASALVLVGIAVVKSQMNWRVIRVKTETSQVNG
jgi:EamA domain-containing membrane protein RarD